MRYRLFFAFVTLFILILVLAFNPYSGNAQGGACCDSGWKLPLPTGKWLITQGDQDSCVSSHCYSLTQKWQINLYALDIVSASEKTIKTMGAQVLAPADGTVWDEFWDGYGGGNVLKIEHGKGGPVTIYLHLSKYLVGKGASVKQGDPVAEIGNSTTEGKSMGAHLHLVVFKSKADPTGLKITSWDGNKNFSTKSIINSTNGSGSIPVTESPQPQSAPGRPSLSQPDNSSSSPQNKEITLTWNSSANATQYKVELWGGPYSTMTPCDWQSEASCYIGTMNPGVMQWHVRARNSSGQQSDWSNTWTFTIQGPTQTPPPSPTHTTTPLPQSPSAPSLRDPSNGASYPQSQDIWFAWNYVSGADQYYLEYWGGPYGTLNSGWITDVAYHIGTMWPGAYKWHVKSRGQNGVESNWSDTSSFTVTQSATSIPPTSIPPTAVPPTQIPPTVVPQPPTAKPQPSFTGNIAPQANRSPDGIGSSNAFDGDLSTFWSDGLGHGFTLTLSLPDSFDISRILVWDRPQNSPDNQQINQIIISLSNGWSRQFGMNSGGPRCIDVTLSSPQTITSVTLQANDASGNNGLSEVEIWVGSKTGGPTCSNSGTMP